MEASRLRDSAARVATLSRDVGWWTSSTIFGSAWRVVGAGSRPRRAWARRRPTRRARVHARRGERGGRSQVEGQERGGGAGRRGGAARDHHARTTGLNMPLRRINAGARARAGQLRRGRREGGVPEGGHGTAMRRLNRGTRWPGDGRRARDDVQTEDASTTTTTTSSGATSRSLRVYTRSPRWTCAAKVDLSYAAGKVSLVTNVASE